MSDDESASASFSEEGDGSFASGSEDEKPKKAVAARKKKTDDDDKPKVSKKPKAAAKKKPAKEKTDDDDDESPKSPRGKAAAEDFESKTIEQIYQKKTPLEHILLRPDSYIGSVEEREQEMWVYQDSKGMVWRSIKYPPGLYKIYDEILVNAADNKQRDPKNMDTIRIDIKQSDNSISVYNNGQSLPVEIHKEEGCYVAELVFGHLLTGSNFDDSVKRVVGGRNGYGAKLCNIFSTEFTVETCDSKRKKQLKQVFSNNMRNKTEPVITSASGSSDWTRITFKPDLKKFKLAELTDDIVALLTKRAYDIAGTNPNVKVILNGTRIPIKSFKDYVNLYIKNQDGDDGPKMVYLEGDGNERWQLCASVADGEFQQVSFVNSICTMKGGTHVDSVVQKLTKHLLSIIQKKREAKAAGVKPAHVKNHLAVFLNCLIENPAFDSQTKEHMNSKASSFGSEIVLTEKFLKAVAKCGIVNKVLSFAAFKSGQTLAKQSGGKKERVKGINKLEDANDAGSKNSDKCTLILTEGDSAKSLAVSGLAVVGRDRYGVFPLKGKLMNVRDASPKQLLANKEIQSITKILGLKYGKKYESVKELRYGHLMIMADQDHDGSHIKGLVINYVAHFWPTLLKMPGFLTEFITPIVKATKGQQEQQFFTLPEFQKWKEEHNNGKGWHCKYYKGLGTSNPQEAKEYFSELGVHKIDFAYKSPNDDKQIDLVFNKKKVAERKEWLENFRPGTHVDHKVTKLPYEDFINKEFILFSIADCVRSIPSIMDGFKPGHRKILFACFKRNLKNEIKVAQLAGYVAEHSAYHHGEQSLQSTIVGMAQSFVGKNNINMLYPSGMFGTRLQGGKDAASARYIYTRLCHVTRALFHADDDALLEYLDEDGQSIEPKYYAPVIPMVLVNGSEGIGTGWSTSIPMYDPRTVIENLRRLIEGDEPVAMSPWYRGFKGRIDIDEGDKSYRVSGAWEQLDEQTIRVTELPVGVWTQNYKKFLESVLIGGSDGKANKKGKKKGEDEEGADAADDEKPKKGAKGKKGKEEKEKGEKGAKKVVPFVDDYKEHHTDTQVDFRIKIPATQLTAMLNDGSLEKRLKLFSTIPRSNMHLFDADGRIHKYDTPEDILKYFYSHRIVLYEKRKQHLLTQGVEEWRRVDNKLRFIQMVIDGKLVVAKKKKADLMKELQQLKFHPFPKKSKVKAAAEIDNNDEEDEDESPEAGAYDYLLSLPLWSLTYERLQQLEKEKQQKEEELAQLKKLTPADLWIRDLNALSVALTNWEETEYLAMMAAKKKKGGKRKDNEEEDYGMSKKKSVPKKDAFLPKPILTSETWKPVVKEEKPKKKKAAAEKKVKDESQSTLDSFNFKTEAGVKRKAESTDAVVSDLSEPEDKPKEKVAVKAFEKKPKGAAVKKVEEKSSEDEAGMGLLQKIAKLKREREAQGLPVGSPLAPAKPVAKVAPPKAVKKEDSDSDDDLMLFDEKQDKPKPKASAKSSKIIQSDEDEKPKVLKKAAPRKKKDSDSEGEEVKAKPKAPKKESDDEADKPKLKKAKAAAVKKVAPKKKANHSDSEEELLDGSGSDSDGGDSAPAATANRGRRAVAAKPVSYKSAKVSDSEEDEDPSAAESASESDAAGGGSGSE